MIDNVRQLQEALIAHGIPLRYGADGIMGPATRQAVSDWCALMGRVVKDGEDPVNQALTDAIVDTVPTPRATQVIEGCDVSGYQQADKCDWAAAFESGCRFVFVKLSEGLRPMTSARTHVVNIRHQAPEMLIGGYHYGRMAKDPDAQAFVAQSRADTLGIRLALDLEDWADGWNATKTTAWLRSFAAHITTPPILYVQPSFWKYRLAGSDEFSHLPLWHAGSWKGKDLPTATDAPTHMTPPWDRVSVWQTHGNRGRLPWYRDGKGAIDRDVFLGSADELAQLMDTRKEGAWSG